MSLRLPRRQCTSPPRGTNRPRWRRPATLFAVGAVVVGGSGVAVAAWLASGSGPADARAITAADLVISAATPTADLYPGATGALRLTVSNPNPYPVRLTTAAFGAVTATPVGSNTCANSSVAPVDAGPVLLGSQIDLAAASGPVTVTVPGAVQMLTSAENGCQGASFRVTVTLSGTSV